MLEPIKPYARFAWRVGQGFSDDQVTFLAAGLCYFVFFSIFPLMLVLVAIAGHFLSADEALQFGLVNHVVPHDELIPFTRRLALDIIGNDQPGVRQIRQTYAAITAEREGWEIEARDGRRWRDEHFSAEAVAARRAAIQARGRQQ